MFSFGKSSAAMAAVEKLGGHKAGTEAETPLSETARTGLPEAEKDFGLTERAQEKSRHERLHLLENMHATLKEKGDNVAEVSHERYAELILEQMSASDHNYKLVTFEILKHTLAIPYEEKHEKLAEFEKQVDDLKNEANGMKGSLKALGFKWGERRKRSKRLHEFVGVLEKIEDYLKKMKKLSDGDRKEMEEPKKEKVLNRKQRALLKQKMKLKKEFAKLDKELEKRWKVPKTEVPAEESADAKSGAEVIDLEKVRKEKEEAKKVAEAVTLKPMEEKERKEAVATEVAPEAKSANG